MKKTLFKLLGFATLAACLFTACPGNPGNVDDPNAGLEVAPGTMGDIDPVIKAASELGASLDPSHNWNIVMFYVEGKKIYDDRALYMWTEGGTGKMANQPMEKKKQGNYTFGYNIVYDGTNMIGGLPVDVGEALMAHGDVKIIVKVSDSTWSWQTIDMDMPTSSGVNHYLVISDGKSKGEATVVPLPEVLTPQISTATMESPRELKVTLSVSYGLMGSADSNGFKIVDANGTEYDVADVKNYAYKDDENRSHNFTDTLYLKLASPADLTKTLYVQNEKFGLKVKINTANALKEDIKSYIYSGTDLGLTLNGSTASFKVFAPVASDVQLLLFATSAALEEPGKIIPMTGDPATGVWSVANVDVTGYKYYKYRIQNGSDTNDVCDIYAKAASADSVAAQIVDINEDASAKPTGWTDAYYNPFGNTGAESKLYTDAVIYEMHIRDWSRLEVADSTGKFVEIAEGTKVIEHIKNLGITHVQILPAFDYAQKNDDDQDNDGIQDYNWGYNPYHYNVPEGRYVKDMVDGTDAVKQFRQLIKAFHDAGIAVNMDVVYNHTAGTGKGSLYDMTAPYYYYRLNPDGSYANGSGCGNETDSEAPMYRKYMIESLVHWMKDYHVNGFRFDLMGLHDTETMKEVYKALKEVDPNVMVYGEPWQGGSYAGKGNPADKLNINECATSATENGVAFFNDEIRNGIKGSEYPEFSNGHVSSGDCSPRMIAQMNGLFFSKKAFRSINYVECHDNLTLADKLALVMNNKTSPVSGNWVGSEGDGFTVTGVVGQGRLGELKKRDELAACYMFLAQGIPFINGGQEFLRSKKGDENSYISSDSVNEIKQTYIDSYKDVTAFYKGLIALRKAYPESFGHCMDTTFVKVNGKGLVNKYTTEGFVVYFNASEAAEAITDGETGKVVDISTGAVVVADAESTVESIPALSCIIIKK